MACMVFADAIQAGLEYFKALVDANQRNIYPLNPLQRRPLFPHPQIYRDTIVANLDAARLQRLHTGPDIRVLIALMPRWLGPRSGFLLGLLAYEAEWLMPSGPHVALGRRAGFESEVASVRDCRTAEQVADLVLHSSCTPPITPLYRRRTRPVLDGGLIDCAPVETIPAPPPPMLILLTAPYPPAAIPRIDGRVYAQPSEAVPVHKWDYTSPERVQATFDLGRRDGERFAALAHANGSRAWLESP
jgi:hypothetical protein